MYAVVMLNDDEEPKAMTAKLQAVDNAAYAYYADRGVYFVRYGGTAQQLAERVGFSKEHGAIRGIVIRAGQNYGYANRDLWNWMGPE